MSQIVKVRFLQIHRDSGIGWIAIKMTERSSKNLAAKEEWEKLEEEPTMETVNRVAAKHQVTGIREDQRVGVSYLTL